MSLTQFFTGYQYGAASLISSSERLENEISVFNDRVQIDVKTSIPAIDIINVREEREEMNFSGQTFMFFPGMIEFSQRKLPAGELI